MNTIPPAPADIPATQPEARGVGGLQRYFPSKPSQPGWEMTPHKDGEWVLFADVHALETLASAPAAPGVRVDEYQPQQGEPPSWFDEWFIAKLDTGERVVLRRLPEEYAYDYKTADHTYFKAFRLKWWMQFPDSKFNQLTAALAPDGGEGE